MDQQISRAGKALIIRDLGGCRRLGGSEHLEGEEGLQGQYLKQKLAPQQRKLVSLLGQECLFKG